MSDQPAKIIMRVINTNWMSEEEVYAELLSAINKMADQAVRDAARDSLLALWAIPKRRKKLMARWRAAFESHGPRALREVTKRRGAVFVTSE